MKFSKSKQSGFTLVEIAIVLVIIGVLLAGVLKGQSMINNSRIKGLVRDMNAVSSSYNGYIDRYQVTPGTEALAASAARGWGALVTVGGTTPLALPVASTFALNANQGNFWQSVAAAGFFTYTTAVPPVNPTNSVGGLIGLAIGAYAIPGIDVCLSGLSPLQAEGVDIITDGPLPAANIGNNVGSLRGAASAAPPLAPGAGAPGAAAYVETAATFWTVCRAM